MKSIENKKQKNIKIIKAFQEGRLPQLRVKFSFNKKSSLIMNIENPFVDRKGRRLPVKNIMKILSQISHDHGSRYWDIIE